MSVKDFAHQLRITTTCLTSIILVIGVSATLNISTAAAADTGTLHGFVFDPNGDAITTAQVSITNFATSEQHHTFSSGDGEYRFTEVTPGTYHLKIQSRGFETRDIPNIVVRADDKTRIDQTLSIASIQAEVTIRTNDVVPDHALANVPADPLVKAAYDDDVEALKIVMLGRSDVNLRDPRTQTTALEYAVQSGNREILQVLLWGKVDVNARDKSGQTVLMLIGEKVTSEIVWDLINAAAKINLRDNEGNTALISVAKENNVEALKVLLDAGAKANVTNDDGQTAMMMAAEYGRVHNIKALILAGADVNARDKEGKTALMYASQNHEPAVVRLLKAHGAIEFEVQQKP